MVDAPDLKSVVFMACRFESGSGHQLKWRLPMRLSEKAYDDVHVGMSVISAIGTPGKVSEKIMVLCDCDGNRNVPGFVIDWENGKKSDLAHWEFKNVTVKE